MRGGRNDLHDPPIKSKNTIHAWKEWILGYSERAIVFGAQLELQDSAADDQCYIGDFTNTVAALDVIKCCNFTKTGFGQSSPLT